MKAKKDEEGTKVHRSDGAHKKATYTLPRELDPARCA